MRRAVSTASFFAMAVITFTSVLTARPASAAAPAFTAPSTAGLPAPYSDWHVTLAPEGANPQVLTLEFDSPTLGLRTVNTVFVPNSYTADGAPSPVLYSLHGTVFTQLDTHLLDPVTSLEAMLAMTSAAGGYKQTQLSKYDSQLAAAHFLVVAPDTTQGTPWCETCSWIDSKPDALPNVPPVTAVPRNSSTFLHKELYPLVEHLFNVRTDRAGRGVTGFSMGGWGAMLEGFKHPDRYGLVASVSGVYDPLIDPDLRLLIDGVGWLHDQGYGTSLTDTIWWRNFSPAELLTNVVGTGQKILMSRGDACLPLTSLLSAPDCQTYSPIRNPVAAYIETIIVRQFAHSQQDIQKLGLPVTFVEKPGVHGANNHDVYANDILPMANAYFAQPRPTPATFSYKAVEPAFSVWGYDVAVQRQHDEFLVMDHARTDGHGLSMTGAGTVTLCTPATLTPGSSHTVTITGGTAPGTTTAVADAAGRLTVHVPLGASTATANVAIS